MSLTIYIKSRGSYIDNDYHWIDENNQSVATPESIKEIQEFIQSDARSIVLQQKETSLLLLVTGIESNRKDIQGRMIRNSIAWLKNDILGNWDDSDEDTHRKILQQIAACALRNELDDRINSNIIAEKGDFRVLWEEILKLKYNYSKISSLRSPDQENLTPKICKNTDKSREELANELETTDLSRDFLVIVTGNKSEETLKKAGVWRGLSNLIPYEEWQEYEPNQQQNLENFVEDVGEIFEGVRKEFDKFIAKSRKRNRRYRDKRNR
ncbi:hypothetical protein [Geitlerinema sp. PCC 9228]|uniref:hypothetical protein n=1 Tax=Geitlerinema sp. PCC 9228 TaxID=111611 RepID=UPI0008F9CBC8|nr:hypothetical protein [Geitlerinema sp. PCC 9228]